MRRIRKSRPSRPLAPPCLAAALLAVTVPQLGVPTEAAAYFADCGQPLSKGASMGAADALYILKAGVGQPSAPCLGCVCDVTGTNGISAPDALLALKKAVGQEGIVFDCPADVTKCVDDCTATNVRNAIGALTTGQRVTKGASLALRCTSADNGDLKVTGDDVDTVSVDDVIITLEDRPGVTFECDGSCEDKTFLGINGEKVTVERFSVKGYGRAFVVNDHNFTLQHMVEVSGFSDVGVENGQNKEGTEIRHVTFDGSAGIGVSAIATTLNGGDCAGIILEEGDPSPVGDDLYPFARRCYNVAIYDSEFTSVGEPVKFRRDGRYLLARTTMTASSNSSSVGPSAGDDQSGDDDFESRFSDVTIDGTTDKNFETGLRFSGDDDGVLNVLVDSEVKGGAIRGVWADKDTNVRLRDSTIRDNGGTEAATGGLDFEGGLVASSNRNLDTPYVNAGTEDPDEPGNNLICGNVNRTNAPANEVHDDDGVIDSWGNTVGACP